ncbi:MAG: DUF3237 domain-containing protein [Pseudomonadaceae bacterium]|nr:DUF3237 domain-containing protein [Pseudomonadaceae bacterium]
MKLTPLFVIRADLSDNFVVGAAPAGNRTVAVVSGGRFEGERLSGDVLPPAADWVLMDSEGWGRIDVRLCLKTDDDANIYMHYLGWLRFDETFASSRASGKATEFGDLYFVTHPSFETGDERYQWLNHLVTVAEGRVVPGGVEYQVYACEPGA